MLDLGKKYTERVFLFSSCFILFYGILGVFLGLNFFKILDYDIQPITWAFSLFDIVVVSTILITQL